jgi:hypothetical protein
MNPYIRVICSNETSLVDLIDLYSKNSDGSSHTPAQQRSWAAQASGRADVAPAPEHRAHAVRRRLGADACTDITRRYATGETAKALAEEFGVARNSILNLLRENNVVVRCQPPSAPKPRYPRRVGQAI